MIGLLHTIPRDAGRSTMKNLCDQLNLTPYEALSLPKWLIGFADDGGGGGNEPDLSALEGLSDDDLNVLEELKDLSPEDVEALAETQEQGDEKDQIIAGQKVALRKERTERRALAKELKAVKAEIEKIKPKPAGKPAGNKDDEESETDKESAAALKKAEERSEKLASRLATSAVDTAIIKALQSSKAPKFKDTDDALTLIKREEIDFEQDDEDPSEVDVDEDTVMDALKALAKRKPHLLVTATTGEGGNSNGSGGSGSKFGGGSSGKPVTQADALKTKYPALARRR